MPTEFISQSRSRHITSFQSILPHLYYIISLQISTLEFVSSTHRYLDVVQNEYTK